MSEPFYLARARVEKVGHLHRRAYLDTGQAFDIGVHGPVVGLFKLSPERELPLPVDYIVASTGG
jgi:hypothetical protein